MNTLINAALFAGNDTFMKQALLILGAILAILVISCIAFTVTLVRSRDNSKGNVIISVLLYLVTLFVAACLIICFVQYKQAGAPNELLPPDTSDKTVSDTTVETTEETTVPTEPPIPTVTPAYTASSNPSNWKVNWQILSNGSKVDSYNRSEVINFGLGSDYTAMEGIISFRGDNYRSGATYGTTDVVNKTLTKKWNKNVGSFNGWCGCGWTGQPLVVRWDDETKAILGIYESKKAKEGLVEVIYATLDGHIYFYDMDDGSYTRDPINMKMNFKGAGSLDPRGYPIMYVGGGDKADKYPKMFAISLIDNKIIWEQTGADKDAYRKWYAFDSAPLVSADTDTLIWPGENGILYTMKLNTQYDKAAGTLSMSPDNIVKTRYKTNIGRKVGYEASAIAVGQYVYIGDNGGMFFCVDLQTMEIKWAQNVKDDVNATPVFEWGDDGKGYIYVGSSMEYAKGNCYIIKLDANTGEIVWERKFTDVTYNEAVSGGILSSPLLGKKGTELEGLIIYPIARTPSAGAGTIVALNTETGETVWEVVNNRYHWSSPVAVYANDGKAYFILCDSAGKATMYNASGEVITSVALKSNVEASPVVFENNMVVGTRGYGVFGIAIG